MTSGLVTIPITGRFVDASDRPANGYLLLVPLNRVTGNNWIVVGAPVRIDIKAGIATGRIIVNQAALSATLYLRVTECITGEIPRRAPYIIQPDGTSVDLSTEPQVFDPPPGQLYIPASALGQPGGVATLGPDGLLSLSQRPPGGGGDGITLEEADARYARIEHTHTIAEITGLVDALNSKASTAALDAVTAALAALAATVAGKQDADPLLADIAGLVPGQGDTIQFRDGHYTSRTLTELRADLGALANIPGLKLYDVEAPEYGAVGDGIADDFEAFRLAHSDMLSQGHLGALFCPRIARYRLDLDVPGRLVVSPDEARAFFPWPMRPRSAGVEKAVYGIVGVGEPETERAAELGGTPVQVNTASAIIADYSGTFTWSPTEGLPCVFGGPDADMTDNTGNTFSNVHLVLRNIILRNSNNPSLTMVNAEQMSTCDIERVRVDVIPVLDQADLCTHPTGGSILLPRSNNNTVVRMRNVIVVGHYAGIPLTEHLFADVVTALRCTIGAFTRRPNSHPMLVLKLLTEQCPWGIAGWDPAGEGPNLGVVDIHGMVAKIVEWGIEDFGYNLLRPDLYTPLAAQRRTHVLNRNDTWGGSVELVARINSELEAPGGNGVPPIGQSSSLYVTGLGGNTVNTPRLALLSFNGIADAQRLQGGVPSNPVTTPPHTPTIGAATAAIESAQIEFTPAATGPPATSFTATAYNSSNVAVGTETGPASPLSITGLAADVTVTIRVKANNGIGSSAESANSNAVTPTGSLGLPSDNFNRANGPLGVSSSGHTYQGNPAGTFVVQDQQAVNDVPGGTTLWNPAYLDTGESDYVVAIDTIHNQVERGLVGRMTDDEHGYYLDLNYDSPNTATGRLYSREGGSFRPLGSGGFTVSGLIAGQVVRLKMRFTGDQITAYVNPNPEVDVQRQQVTDTEHVAGAAGFASLDTPGAAKATFDNLTTSFL